MYDTHKIINQWRIYSSLRTRPALPASAEPDLGGFRGPGGSSRPRASPPTGSPAISSRGCAPQPHLDCPLIGVAYCLLAHSRLGCSANLDYSTAYHTTSCKSRGNTKQSSDKKSRGLRAFSPAARFGHARPSLGIGPLSTMLFLVLLLFFSEIFLTVTEFIILY